MAKIDKVVEKKTLSWTKKINVRLSKIARRLEGVIKESQKCGASEVTGLSRKLSNTLEDIENIAHQFGSLPVAVAPILKRDSKKVDVGDDVVLSDRAREKYKDKEMLTGDEIRATYKVISLGRKIRVAGKGGLVLFFARKELSPTKKSLDEK